MNLLEDKQIPAPVRSSVFQIRIKGHLGAQWTDWFDGMNITLEEDGDTVLQGSIADQATLYGLLKKIRDLGMPLVSVNPGLPDRADISANINKSTNEMHMHTEKEKK